MLFQIGSARIFGSAELVSSRLQSKSIGASAFADIAPTYIPPLRIPEFVPEPPFVVDLGPGVPDGGGNVCYDIFITVNNGAGDPGVSVVVTVNGETAPPVNVPLGGPYIIQVCLPDPGPNNPPDIDVLIDVWQYPPDLFDLPDVEGIEYNV